ncbi:hypothetical protein ACS0TY_011982 [Phlomoides rotata]
MLVVNDRWLEDNGEMVIINVYASCLFSEKAQLWDTIQLVIAQNVDVRICVLGDFNSIIEEGERCGRGEVIDRRDIRSFDYFISSSGLVDLQLWGRKFTWYKSDGSCKSKLDRIMIYIRPLPLILRNLVTDWGPKPFKFFNGWIKHPEFRDFCCSKWESYNVNGWKSYSLKEKLRMLKQDLKGWSREAFGSLHFKMESQRETIERLDRFDEVFGLEEEEVIKRNKIGAELKRNMIWNEKNLFQKAKSKWLKEGDVNSKFFHRWINKRIKVNGIEGLFVNDTWVESKVGIRHAIFNHFSSHFCSSRTPRVALSDDLCLKKLDHEILEGVYFEHGRKNQKSIVGRVPAA